MHAIQSVVGSTWSRGGVAWIVVVLLLAGCSDSSTSDKQDLNFLSGVVLGGDGLGIAGATVYLVPVDAIDSSPITARGILDGSAEPFDEPLEDAVRNNGAALPQAVTNRSGSFRMNARELGIDPDVDYYVFVQPNDGEHLPGGDLCRFSRPGSSLLGTDVRIEVSSRPPASAQYVGSSTCLACHADHGGVVYTAHKLAITAMDQVGGLQDPANFDNFFDALDKFVDAADYTDGTVLTFGDVDPARDEDKFEVYEGASPPQIATPMAYAYLWRDTADGAYKITLENLVHPDDPMSPVTLTARLTYGGLVAKQRYLVEFPGRQGHYPFLQYQAYPGDSTGSDDHYDRTRAVWRDYRLDYFWDLGSSMLRTPPPTATFEGNCAGCHFVGYEPSQDMGSGEWLADAVNDPSGAFDIDGDMFLDEINIGCESCHGAGSEHVALNVSQPSRRHIVDIAALSPSRENMVCGRCHNTIVGAGTLPNMQPLNAMNRFAPPGISRADLLAEYATQKGPALEDYWIDEMHSRTHHQQYGDLLRSKKYRNDRQLLACSNCHDPHADRSLAGQEEFRHNLLGDPADPNSILCARCHAIDPVPHMIERTAAAHAGSQSPCYSCHMPRTAQSGAGQYGTLLAPPTGTAADIDTVYWMNDIASHLFEFVHKYDLGVAGVPPGTAMPAPYTNACGTCHDPSNLPNVTPIDAR